MKKILEIIPIEKAVGMEITEYLRFPKKGDIFHSVYQKHIIKFEQTSSEEENKEINPGIYAVRKQGYNYVLKPKEVLLEPNVAGVEAVDISKRIKTFFDNSNFFTTRGLIPKRGALLHGPPGCGKTHSINQCILDLVGKNGVAIYIAMDECPISALVATLEESKLNPSVDKLFLVIEDLGGGEMTDQKKGFLIPSMSDLLALLDGNSLPWKKLPTVMLSTTNYPKNFLANIIDRPGRFDEIITFSLPTGEAALAYAESLDVPLTDFDKRSILKGNIGLAHVKDAVVRSAVYGEAIHNTLEYMRERSKQIQKDLDAKLNPFE